MSKIDDEYDQSDIDNGGGGRLHPFPTSDFRAFI
jgi:hypothetical protein